MIVSVEVVTIPSSTKREAERHCNKIILGDIDNRYETDPLLLMAGINSHMVNRLSDKSV